MNSRFGGLSVLYTVASLLAKVNITHTG